jgi:hypothetical protein
VLPQKTSIGITQFPQSWKEKNQYFCDCTYDIKLWRVHKSDVVDGGKSYKCGNDDIKKRLSDRGLKFDVSTEGLNDNVHCDHQ